VFSAGLELVEVIFLVVETSTLIYIATILLPAPPKRAQRAAVERKSCDLSAAQLCGCQAV